MNIDPTPAEIALARVRQVMAYLDGHADLRERDLVFDDLMFDYDKGWVDAYRTAADRIRVALGERSEMTRGLRTHADLVAELAEDAAELERLRLATGEAEGTVPT